MARYPDFRECYEARARDRFLEGHVIIEWEIAPEGYVSDARAVDTHGGDAGPPAEDRIRDPSVRHCIRGVMAGLKFPPARKPTRAAWTFSFRPSHKRDAGAQSAADGGS